MTRFLQACRQIDEAPTSGAFNKEGPTAFATGLASPPRKQKSTLIWLLVKVADFRRLCFLDTAVMGAAKHHQ